MKERRCDEHVAIGVDRILAILDRGHNVSDIYEALIILGVSINRAYALAKGGLRR